MDRVRERLGKGAAVKVGDSVSWNTAQGPTHGKIVERRTKDFQLDGQQFKASGDEPKSSSPPTRPGPGRRLPPTPWPSAELRGLGDAVPLVQPAQERRGPPVRLAGQPHERRHQHPAYQGGVHQDRDRHTEPEQLDERHL
ncbi:MAG: DUF2945 domain-containing protein [Nocardioidaceae bacterium]